MKNTSGLKRGGSPGRPAGSVNKRTLAMRVWLQELLEEAFHDRKCRKNLLEQIKTLTIDPKVLQLLFSFAHGRPGAVDDEQPAAQARYYHMARLLAGRGDDDDDDGSSSKTTH